MILMTASATLPAYAAGPGDGLPAQPAAPSARMAEAGTSGTAEADYATAEASTASGQENPADSEAAQEDSGAAREDYDAAEAALLQERAAEVLSDNVLRYEELQDAVHNGNPSVAAALKNYNDRLEQYLDAMNEAVFDQRNAGTERKNARKDGDSAGAGSWDSEYDIYKASADMYREMYKSMSDYASQRSLRQVERQMTVATQSLMISYESLRHQRDTLRKEAELRRRQAELAETKRGAGLAAESDVLSARASLLDAENRLSSAEDSLQEVYRNLCYSVGKPDDGSLVIAELPAPDPARISAMDLEADTRKAIGNNATLISRRGQNRGSATTVTEVRKRTNAEGEQQLTAKMKSLYEAVLQKQSEYGTAVTAWEKAQETKRIADLKASAGLAGAEEQLEAEMEFLSAEASFKASELAFLQAMDTYDWAVTGITSLE